jgi:hypothetical protein
MGARFRFVCFVGGIVEFSAKLPVPGQEGCSQRVGLRVLVTNICLYTFLLSTVAGSRWYHVYF